MKHRIEKLRNLLIDKRLDAFIVSNPINISYISGLSSSDAYLLVSPGEKTIITDFRYKELAQSGFPDYTVKIALSSKLSVIKSLIKKYCYGRVGFEADNILYNQYDRLTDRAYRLVPVTGMIEELRVIKDEQEIELIKRAISIAKTAVYDSKKKLHTGISESGMAALIDSGMRLRGAQKSAFETIVAFGNRTSLPHARSTNRKLFAGDHVLIDLGAVYRDYSSDLTRTFFLSKIDRKIKSLYHIVADAQKKAIEKVRPGTQAKSVDKAARDYIKRFKYQENFGHALGHGVGRQVHEAPRINSKDKMILKPGMVFTIEPGIYIQGVGGVRIEDVVLVTQKGCDVLS